MSIFINNSSKIFINCIFHLFGIMTRNMFRLSISIYKIVIYPEFLNFLIFDFFSFLSNLFHQFLILLNHFHLLVEHVTAQYQYLWDRHLPWVLEYCSYIILLDFISDIFHQFLIILNSFHFDFLYLINFIRFLVSNLSILYLLSDSLSPVNVSPLFSAFPPLYDHQYLSGVFHHNPCQYNSGNSLFPISKSHHLQLILIWHLHFVWSIWSPLSILYLSSYYLFKFSISLWELIFPNLKTSIPLVNPFFH